MTIDGFPEFRPHRLLRSGHAQTLAGVFLPWKRTRYRAVQHRVTLPDGDAVVLHDDRPSSWRPEHRIVLLMHGLAGCYLSPYMIRAADKFAANGVRTFRLDLRGCGAGRGLSRKFYNAGRTDDVLQVLRFLATLCPESPVVLVGFSLSGNVLLKFLGEEPDRVPPHVVRAMAVNPPIDLKACVQQLDRFANRIYDRFFVKRLNADVRALRRTFADMIVPEFYRHPRRLYDFDDSYTAPMAGYRNADDYYAQCSARQFVPGIAVPTLILSAADDPLVPLSSFEQLNHPPVVSLHIADHGGHLGYIARRNTDPDRRWLDWRILDWATA